MYNTLDFEENLKNLPPSDSWLLEYWLKQFTSSCTRIRLLFLISFISILIHTIITIIVKSYYMKDNFDLSMSISSFINQLVEIQPKQSTIWAFGITSLGICIASAILYQGIQEKIERLDSHFNDILIKQFNTKHLYVWIQICKTLQSELASLGIMVGLLIPLISSLSDVIFSTDEILAKYYVYLLIFSLFSVFMLVFMPFFHLFTKFQFHLEHILKTPIPLNQTIYATFNDNNSVKIHITDTLPNTNNNPSSKNR